MIEFEFSRPVRIDTLGQVPRALSIEADEAERAALAARFGLQGIAKLSAEARLTGSTGAIRASGKLVASVTQSCVATGAPVEAELAEDLDVEFRPEPTGGSADDEVELGEGELDVIFYEGASVDLGEAAAQTLLLALDPFPRCAEADAVLAEAGVHKEGEDPRTGPLAGLKDLLSGKK